MLPIQVTHCWLYVDVVKTCQSVRASYVSGWHLGTRQSWDQRLLRWLAGFWRPAPYVYLYQSSATTYQNHNHRPPPSAYYVTEASTLDHHLFHDDVTDADSAPRSISLEHPPAAITASGSSEQADTQQEPGSPSLEQQPQLSRSRQSSQAGVGSGRHSNSRWQWV